MCPTASDPSQVIIMAPNASLACGLTANDLFGTACAEMKEASHTPVAVFDVSNGDRLAVAVRNSGSTHFKSNVQKINYSIGGGLHCKTCADFMKKEGPLQFSEGMMYSCCTPGPYAALCQEVGSFQKFEILTGVIGVAEAGGFDHFSATPTEVSTLKEFSLSDYNWFLKQHLGTMIRLLSINAEEGIIESLELLIIALDRVTYGDKLIHAMRWFLTAMHDYLAIPDDAPHYAKHVVAARALLNARLAPGTGNERIICTVLHQAKDNGLDALACARDEGALIKMLNARFSPTTYCRPTADATDGQLQEAMKLFANLGFKTPTLMPIDAIPNYSGVLVPTVSSGVGKDATAIWGASLAKKKGASGFAARSGGFSTTYPKTFKELMRRISEFPGLEVNTTNQVPVCLTEYEESAREAFKYDHLWSFHNSRMISMFGIYSTWCTVNALLEMGRNLFIGLTGARPDPKMGNTCFPSFLTTAYERRCRVAFEELNKTTMVVTGPGPFALGTGTSRVDESGNSHSPMRFRFNGNEFEISKF